MLKYEGANPSELVGREVRRGCDRNGIEPELRETPIALDVNVNRLFSFVAVEEEAIRPENEDSRHREVFPMPSIRRRGRPSTPPTPAREG